jgi:hypothetical protein
MLFLCQIFLNHFFMVLKEVGIFRQNAWDGDGKYFPKEGDILHQRILEARREEMMGGSHGLGRLNRDGGLWRLKRFIRFS